MATSVLYEPILNGLLAYLQANIPANTFLTFARGIAIWENLNQTQNGLPTIRQPALYLYDGVGFGDGTLKYERKGHAQPPIRTLGRTLIVYNRILAPAGQPGGTLGGKGQLPLGGGPLFNPLVEAIETALNIPDSASLGTFTVGGLVAYCRLEGTGHFADPTIDENGQGMATLPVKILVP